MSKSEFAHDDFMQLLNKAEERMLENVFPVAVNLLINAKYGSGQGLLSRVGVSKDDTRKAIEAMLPLEAVLREAARRAFVDVFSGMLANPKLRKYTIARVSSIAGKLRKKVVGGQKSHIKWLEKQMRRQNENYTAKEHFKELKHCNAIDSENASGVLEFNYDFLVQELGWDGNLPAPSISINTVRKVLTRINQSR